MIQFDQAVNGRVLIAGQPYQRGLLRVTYSLGGSITIRDPFGMVLEGIHYSQLINGATGNFFASLAELKAFVDANFYRVRNGGVTPPPPPTFDADAQAFLNAAGILQGSQYGTVSGLAIWQAMDRFVRDLKGETNPNYATSAQWNKHRAIWPLVGGSAASHKLNLKDPRDLDAAFRLSFYGSPTHSSNGIAWNGVNQYADSHFMPATHLPSASSVHLSYYSRDNIAGPYVEMGVTSASANTLHLLFGYAGGFYTGMNSAEAGGGATPFSSMAGFLIGSRVTTTEIFYRHAGNPVVTLNDNVGTRNAGSVFLGCYNSAGTPNVFSARGCSFSSVGDGLSEAETLNYHRAVQALQTALNRQL